MNRKKVWLQEKPFRLLSNLLTCQARNRQFNPWTVHGRSLTGHRNALEKAWIFGLMYKLIELYHLPPSLIKLVFSYLKDRNLHNKIKKSVSLPKLGDPQWAKLSPKLFNLFINNIPNYLHTRLAIFFDTSFFRPITTRVM